MISRILGLELGRVVLVDEAMREVKWAAETMLVHQSIDREFVICTQRSAGPAPAMNSLGAKRLEYQCRKTSASTAPCTPRTVHLKGGYPNERKPGAN